MCNATLKLSSLISEIYKTYVYCISAHIKFDSYYDFVYIIKCMLRWNITAVIIIRPERFINSSSSSRYRYYKISVYDTKEPIPAVGGPFVTPL